MGRCKTSGGLPQGSRTTIIPQSRGNTPGDVFIFGGSRETKNEGFPSLRFPSENIIVVECMKKCSSEKNHKHFNTTYYEITIIYNYNIFRQEKKKYSRPYRFPVSKSKSGPSLKTLCSCRGVAVETLIAQSSEPVKRGHLHPRTRMKKQPEVGRGREPTTSTTMDPLRRQKA